MMINWKEKLSSRKLWCAVAGFVTAVGSMLGWGEVVSGRIVALVMAVGSLISYVIAEGWADAAGAGADDNTSNVVIDQ